MLNGCQIVSQGFLMAPTRIDVVWLTICVHMLMFSGTGQIVTVLHLMARRNSQFSAHYKAFPMQFICIQNDLHSIHAKFLFFCFGTLNSPFWEKKFRSRGWSHELEISDLNKYCKHVNASRSHHGVHSQLNLSPESYSTCRLSYPIRDSLEVSFVLNYFQKPFFTPTQSLSATLINQNKTCSFLCLVLAWVPKGF